MNRREFLKSATTASAVAAITIAPAVMGNPDADGMALFSNTLDFSNMLRKGVFRTPLTKSDVNNLKNRLRESVYKRIEQEGYAAAAGGEKWWDSKNGYKSGFMAVSVQAKKPSVITRWLSDRKWM